MSKPCPPPNTPPPMDDSRNDGHLYESVGGDDFQDRFGDGEFFDNDNMDDQQRSFNGNNPEPVDKNRVVPEYPNNFVNEYSTRIQQSPRQPQAQVGVSPSQVVYVPNGGVNKHVQPAPIIIREKNLTFSPLQIQNMKSSEEVTLYPVLLCVMGVVFGILISLILSPMMGSLVSFVFHVVGFSLWNHHPNPWTKRFAFINLTFLVFDLLVFVGLGVLPLLVLAFVIALMPVVVLLLPMTLLFLFCCCYCCCIFCCYESGEGEGV